MEIRITNRINFFIGLDRLYVVNNPRDLKWYRGRVLNCHHSKTDKPTYDVYFIDYGMTEIEIPLENMRESQPDFNCLPGQAVHCTLKEIAPINDEWDQDTLYKFTEMTKE